MSLIDLESDFYVVFLLLCFLLVNNPAKFGSSVTFFINSKHYCGVLGPQKAATVSIGKNGLNWEVKDAFVW